MRIAIIGANNSFDSLEFHLKDELVNQGYKVSIFDFEKIVLNKIDYGLRQFSLNYDKFRNKQLLKNVLNYSPDLVIGTYRHINPLVVKEVKANNIKIIHINPDQLTTLSNQQIFVEEYDAYFTKDPFMFKFMKDKMSFNTFTYNEAFNPRYHGYNCSDKLTHEKNTNIDVLTFGNLYPYRNRMLKRLLDDNIDVMIFGHKAKFIPNYILSAYQNKAIYGAEKSKLLLGAKIVFNNFHYAEIESVNNKFFEINGSGAFQICDYKPILKDLLPIDPKLVSFKNIDEAVKLIKYYTNKPERRFEIRDQIREHFIENYTYAYLVNKIINSI